MKRPNRTFLASAVALSCVLPFTACSPGTDEEASADETQVEETQEPTALESANETADSSDSAASVAEQTEVTIGETIEDPDMGDTIEIVSAVRNFPSSEKADVAQEGGEIVLLQVTVAPGEEFGGLVSMGDFEISYDDGAEYWNNDTRMITEEMDEAEFSPYEDVSRRDGGEHTGWIAYFPEEKRDTYKMQYQRAGAKVIGSDEEIDEYTKDFEIPAP